MGRETERDQQRSSCSQPGPAADSCKGGAGQRERGAENILEDIIAKNFSNLGNRHLVQETQRIPNRINLKRTMLSLNSKN